MAKPTKAEQGQRPVINISDGTLIPQKGEGGVLTAWNIAFFGAIAIIAYLAIFQSSLYKPIFKFVPDGILATLLVTLIAISTSLMLGLIAGLGRISRNKTINLVATTYVEVVRGIPLLVQLFYIYFGLPQIISHSPLKNIIHLNGFSSAILAITICYGAYMAEIFRAGIQSIPKGQMEAALALGMNRGQAMRKVILPQTVRVILPPIGNEFIALLKDSSLVSMIAVSDLLKRGKEFAATNFNYFETYTVVALIYLVLTLFFSRLIAMMEERLRHNGTNR